jgi:uncharacterized membrane protein YbhN (UPF0104 family)
MSTHVVLPVLFALTAAVFAVVVAVFVVVASSVAVCELVSCAGSSASSAAVVTALGSDIARVVILAFRVLDAVITAFTAAIFASKLNTFSRRFFFWACFPCPGPGILNVMY